MSPEEKLARKQSSIMADAKHRRRWLAFSKLSCSRDRRAVPFWWMMHLRSITWSTASYSQNRPCRQLSICPNNEVVQDTKWGLDHMTMNQISDDHMTDLQCSTCLQMQFDCSRQRFITGTWGLCGISRKQSTATNADIAWANRRREN